jgi:hypothetical protein
MLAKTTSARARHARGLRECALAEMEDARGRNFNLCVCGVAAEARMEALT